MKSHTTINFMYRLAEIEELAAETMSFLNDRDYSAVVTTCLSFSEVNYRIIYANKLASTSSISTSYESMRYHFHSAYRDLEYAIHRPSSVYLNDTFTREGHSLLGTRIYRNPGTNNFAVFNIFPAGYSFIKSGLCLGQCSVQGALHTVGFFAGGARDILRKYTNPVLSAKLLRHSASFHIPSTDQKESSEVNLRDTEVRP